MSGHIYDFKSYSNSLFILIHCCVCVCVLVSFCIVFVFSFCYLRRVYDIYFTSQGRIT